MKTYYVQYSIRHIKPEFLDSYFSILEKNLRRLTTVDIKHSFTSNDGKVFVNIYIEDYDARLASKSKLSIITAEAFNALNYVDEDNELQVEVEKVEVVK